MSRKKKPRACEGYNYHHRKCKVHGGSGRISSGNLIEVPVVLHRSWHRLFGTKTPEQIASVINKTWLDADWELIARRRE